MAETGTRARVGQRSAMRHARNWIGLGVSALCVALLFARVDRHELIEAVRDIQPLWLLPALALLAASLWVRAARWAVIVRPVRAISTRDAASLLVIGYAANNVLPARAGEVVRSVLFQRRHGGSALTALATIVVERVFDGAVLAVFLAAALASGTSSGPLRALALIAGAGFSALLVGLAALSAWPAPVRGLIDRVLRLTPGGLRVRLESLSVRFLDGLVPVRGLSTWTRVFALTTGSWALEAACYWAVGEAFGLALSPWAYLGICGAANLAIAAPSTSGGIGPYEFFAREVTVALGVASGLATAYALVLHAVVLIPVALAGVVLLWREQLGLRTLMTTELPPGPVGSAP
ncbi:MAG: flippase-like domain-containing protein [Dehalococcoidia bacterium]|nr:MAG: flippase-like domain-containing protein [Dehalococcoidia bacterium]